MKHIIYILLVVTVFGCRKDKSTNYSIVVLKDNPYEAILKVNDVPYKFTEGQYQQSIILKEFEVVDVSLDYTTQQTDAMELSVFKEGTKTATVSGNSYMYAIISNSSTSTGGGYSSSGSGSSGSSSNTTWHYCGYPTKDGTPCKRHVSGTTGYCWQHK